MIGQFREQIGRIRPEANAVRISDGIAVVAPRAPETFRRRSRRSNRPGRKHRPACSYREGIAASITPVPIPHHQRAMQRRERPLLEQSGAARSETGSAATGDPPPCSRHPAKRKATVEIAQHEVVRSATIDIKCSRARITDVECERIPSCPRTPPDKRDRRSSNICSNAPQPSSAATITSRRVGFQDERIPQRIKRSA